MFESLRRAMLFGLGAAAMSADKIRQAVDDLVARGEVSADEGRSLYEELTSRVEEQGRSLNDKIRSQIRSTLKDMGVADRTQVAMLESRIETLERRLNAYYVELEDLKISQRGTPPSPPTIDLETSEG